MGIRKTGEWTYYNRFMLESWGHGASYGLYYTDGEDFLQEVAYLQDDWKVGLFEQALDQVNSEEETYELWQRAFYDDWDLDEYLDSIQETEYVDGEDEYVN